MDGKRRDTNEALGNKNDITEVSLGKNIDFTVCSICSLLNDAFSVPQTI
jgi:hypothetical protein